MKKSKKSVTKIMPAYACMAATFAGMISQGLMMPMTVYAETGNGEQSADKKQTELTFAEKSSVTVDVGNVYQKFAEDSGIVSELDITNADRTITITKDGTYTFTGSNYIHESYFDTRICIKSGVTANLICENLEIKNVGMSYGTSASAKDYYNPIYVEENAVLNLLGDGEFSHSANSNYGSGQIRTVAGEGKVEIYEGNFVFDGDTDVNEAVVRTGNIYGAGIFSDRDGNICDTEGNVLSKYTVDTLSKGSLIEEIIYGTEDGCRYMTPEYTATTTEGQLHLYLNSDKTDTVEFIAEGGVVYSYAWSEEEQDYIECAPKYTDVCTVTYVEEDGTEVCKSYYQKGGNVVFPSFGERDVVFVQGDHAFDKTMIIQDETVTVKDTVLELDVTIDGEEYIYEKNITKLPENGYYIDEMNQKCYKGGDVLKESCTLKSIRYEVIDEQEVIKIDSNATMKMYVEFSEYEEAQSVNVELLADVSLDRGLFVEEDMPFQGVFDGKGHTISVDIEETDSYAAPFRYLGGTVKNLVVNGTISSDAFYMGGIATSVVGECSILNCNIAVDMININDYSTIGGIVGCVDYYQSAYIEDCVFSGSFSCDNAMYISGIIGRCEGSAEIKDSLIYTPKDMSGSRRCSVGYARYSDSFEVENCYYVRNWTDVTPGSTQISTKEAESGKLCYLLNHSSGEDSTWHQKLGTDEIPVPFEKEDGVVYEVTGCKEDIPSYNNVKETLSTHTYAPVYVWSEEPDETGDYSVNAHLECVVCDTSAENAEPLEIQMTKTTQDPTCDKDGERIYTASTVYKGRVYTDEKHITLPAKQTEHVYGNIVLEDGSNLISKADCKNGAYYYQACEKCGEINWYDEFEYGEKTGHREEVSAITFEEAEEGYTADAYVICGDCNELVRVQPVEVKKEITEPASCLKSGKVVYTAALTLNDEEYTDTKEVCLEPKGHTCTEKIENIREADCVNAGSYEKVLFCADCQLEFDRETVEDEVTGHNYAEPTFDWTSDGKTCTIAFACTADGCSHITSHETVVTGEKTTDATCSDTGTTTYTATYTDTDKTYSAEGKTYTDTKDVDDIPVDPDNHTGETEVRDAKEATCGEEGYTGDTYCKDCGTKTATGEKTGKSTEHTGETEVRDAKEATCAEEGYTGDTYCKDCGTKTATGEKIGKSTEHTGETEVRDAKEATCAEEGYTGDTYCMDCGTKIATGEIIEKKTHTYGEPTFNWTNDGKTCTVSFVCEKDVTHVTRHEATVTSEVKKGATCSDKGITTYTATYIDTEKLYSAEGKTYTDTKDVEDIPTDETKHAESDILYTGEGEKEPTCTENGIGHTECINCKVPMQTNVNVEATGHTGEIQVKDAKTATCAEDGYTGDTYCKACGTKTAAGTKIAKSTVHTWDAGVVTQKATATKKGEKTYKCKVCKAVKTEEIAALGAPKVGTELISEDGSAIYKVTETGEKGNAVTYQTPTDKKAATVVIPATITIDNITYNVTAISAKAFRNCKKLITVKIGNGVKTIGKSAFEGCKKLKNVTIGKNVTKIGAKAFYGCSKIKTLTVKSGKLATKKIGSKAFAKTPKNMTVKVPKKKYNAYKSMLVKRGVNKKAKFKKN